MTNIGGTAGGRELGAFQEPRPGRAGQKAYGDVVRSSSDREEITMVVKAPGGTEGPGRKWQMK